MEPAHSQVVFSEFVWLLGNGNTNIK